MLCSLLYLHSSLLFHYSGLLFHHSSSLFPHVLRFALNWHANSTAFLCIVLSLRCILACCTRLLSTHSIALHYVTFSFYICIWLFWLHKAICFVVHVFHCMVYMLYRVAIRFMQCMRFSIMISCVCHSSRPAVHVSSVLSVSTEIIGGLVWCPFRRNSLGPHSVLVGWIQSNLAGLIYLSIYLWNLYSTPQGNYSEALPALCVKRSQWALSASTYLQPLVSLYIGKWKWNWLWHCSFSSVERQLMDRSFSLAFQHLGIWLLFLWQLNNLIHISVWFCVH